jgi:hypothetical protein
LTSSNLNTQEKFICDKFDINLVSSLSLFLYEHLAFLMAKDQNEKVMLIQTITFSNLEQLSETISKDEIYQLDLPTRVYVHNHIFSLVPGMVFNPAFLNTYLAFAGEVNQKTSYSTALESNRIHIVGGVSTNIHLLLSMGKTNIEFYHGAISFLSYCFNEKLNLLNQEILIYFFENHFYLAAFSKQELMVFNRFEADNKDTLLKYTLGIIQQLEFNRKLCRINVLGDFKSIGIDNEWGEIYFKNFKLTIPQPNIIYHKSFDKTLESAALETSWAYI